MSKTNDSKRDDETTTETPLADAYVAAYKASYVHVTALRNGGVYGHATTHCDPAGCAGDEHYYSTLDADLVEVGEVVDLADADLDARVNTAYRTWLASDEIRTYRCGGESWQGGEDGVECSPGEIRETLYDMGAEGWDDVTETMWVDNFADPVDPATDEEIADERVCVTTTVDPVEPDCIDKHTAHDWQSPHEVVGGIESNPGCWGKGGGVMIKEVCARCGAYKHNDTWATNQTNGTQGHTSTSYESADDESLAWIQQARDDAMIAACPYSLEGSAYQGPGEYVIAIEVDANDDDACDAIVKEVKDAIGDGWAVRWTGDGNGADSDLRIEWTGGAS